MNPLPHNQDFDIIYILLCDLLSPYLLPLSIFEKTTQKYVFILFFYIVLSVCFLKEYILYLSCFWTLYEEFHAACNVLTLPFSPFHIVLLSLITILVSRCTLTDIYTQLCPYTTVLFIHSAIYVHVDHPYA